MRKSLVFAFAVSWALLLSFRPAAAFDTGPHASITVDTMMRAGFNRNAANAVQVENWLTDYYTSSPTLGSSSAQCDLEKLHTLTQVRYLERYATDACGALRKFSRSIGPDSCGDDCTQ